MRLLPPLEQLRPRQDLAELDGWLEEILQGDRRRARAGGLCGARENAGQTTLRTVAYVPGKVSSDAAELSGWYVLDDFLTDRTGRLGEGSDGALYDRVTTRLGGLTSFLTGLDAWQSGFAADGDRRLQQSNSIPRRAGAVSRGPRPTVPGTCDRVARAGRAAQRTDGAFWRRAHEDYAAIPASSTVANRARVSTATNDYLRALLAGCDPNVEVTSHLDASASVLHEIGIAADLPELLRRRAQVNQDQVELCRLRAGRAGAAASLDSLLGGLTRMSLPEGDANGDAYRQVKALALSIQAIRDSDAGRPDEAAETMGRALDLDPRFETGTVARSAQCMAAQELPARRRHPGAEAGAHSGAGRRTVRPAPEQRGREVRVSIHERPRRGSPTMRGGLRCGGGILGQGFCVGSSSSVDAAARARHARTPLQSQRRQHRRRQTRPLQTPVRRRRTCCWPGRCSCRREATAWGPTAGWTRIRRRSSGATPESG